MTRDRQLANDLIQTNREYEKLKGSNPDSKRTPRETPGQQGPGRRGYDKALFDEWTREELIAHAEGLGLPVDDSIPREQLMDMIEARDATRAR